MTIADILKQAEPLINQILRKELGDQGHYLTGALDQSLEARVSKKPNQDIMEGFAAHYTQWVNNGFPASSASFKQLPFVISYFEKRGLSGKEAVGAAYATIKTWMKEGMPTQASKRFSSTGSRTSAIENAFTGHQTEIDEFIGNSIDFVVEEEFQKEKSETI